MTALLDLLSGLTGFGPEMVWQGFLVFIRAGAALALLPVYGDQQIPVRVRLVLALALALVVAPVVMPGLPAAEGGLIGPILIEAAVGLALGFGLRLIVLALQFAGVVAAQAISIAQLTADTGPEPLPALSQFLIAAGLALAVALDLPVRAAELLILSYQAFPAGLAPRPGPVADWGLRQTVQAFALGFTLATPFLAAAVLYNLAIGLINRAMPQLMVTMIGAPALVLGGLLLLALSGPIMLSVWADALAAHYADPFGTLP